MNQKPIHILEFMSKMPAAELGRLFAEYVNESMHGGWDGFSTRDRQAFNRLFADLVRYGEAGLRDDPDAYRIQASSGVRPFTAD